MSRIYIDFINRYKPIINIKIEQVIKYQYKIFIILFFFIAVYIIVHAIPQIKPFITKKGGIIDLESIPSAIFITFI